MAEQDALITVEEDELITAETTNKNNRYLETLITNYAGELRQYLDSQIALIEKIPVGTTTTFAGNTPPVGWLICDGSAISRETYADLFEVIGITYGEGNGATTFNLPNAIGKFFEGSDTAGVEKEAGLPQHQHNLDVLYTRHGEAGGGGVVNWCNGDWDVTRVNNPVSSNAIGNSIYRDDVTTVQPPAITQLPIIKY